MFVNGVVSVSSIYDTGEEIDRDTRRYTVDMPFVLSMVHSDRLRRRRSASNRVDGRNTSKIHTK